MTKLVLIAALLIMAYLFYKKATARPRMSAPDARALLGVGADASIDDIREAHRRLIAKVHPDSGGSAELASRVNLARDTLVGQVGKT